MSLREKINEQFNIALKSKNKTLVSTFQRSIKLFVYFFSQRHGCKNINLLHLLDFFKRKKFHLDEIKPFSYVAQNHVL